MPETLNPYPGSRVRHARVFRALIRCRLGHFWEGVWLVFGTHGLKCKV